MFSGKTFKSSLPWIILTIGIFAFVYATFGTFDGDQWKLFWRGIGQTFIASGIFSLLLKSYQFIGVFKDELTEIVYEAKYLQNRKDLPEIWERVSKVLFKDKFQKISKDVTSDVKNIYFPTQQVLYYDDYKQSLELELIDPEKRIVRVTQISEFTVVPVEKKSKVSLRFSNTMKFSKSNEAITSYNMNKIKIDNCSIAFSPRQDKSDPGLLHTHIQVELKGSDQYKFETEATLIYCLDDDNTIGLRKSYIIHDFCTKIHLKGLKIDFHASGTLEEFQQSRVKNEHFIEFTYKGLIYPKQGYIIFVSTK